MINQTFIAFHKFTPKLLISFPLKNNQSNVALSEATRKEHNVFYVTYLSNTALIPFM